MSSTVNKEEKCRIAFFCEGSFARSIFALLVFFIVSAPGIAYGGQTSTIAGSDRFETAARQASQAFPNGCDMVIVAGVDSWADAVAATGLAGALDCPILFVKADSIPSVTRATIESLHVAEVVLLGGLQSVSDEVGNALESTGDVCGLVRIGGEDRFATQRAVYEFGKSGYDGVDHWGHELAIVACGLNFPDTLSVSPLAFSCAAPIFLVDSSGQLSLQQEESLLDGEFSKVLVCGGTAAVSDATLGYVEALTSFVSADSTPRAMRLGGVDRYETSAIIADWSVREGYLKWDNLAFASGSLPYDALAGSVVQGKRGSVLLLAGAPSDATVAAAAANRGAIANSTYFGGTGSLSQYFRKETEYRLGWYRASLQELFNQAEGASGSFGVTPIGSDFLPSVGTCNQLSYVLNWMRSSGYQVGFTMIDLKTGQGFSSGSNQVFYSASTIKGPYVAAINKYDPGSALAYAGIMQATINVSSNEGYETLRYRFGSWPFALFMSDSQVGWFGSDIWYSYLRVKDLSKLWIENYDYFYGFSQNGNSAWCRNLYTSSYHSPIYYELCSQYAVYTKPGWINDSNPRAFNDSGIVMAGDRPYVITICSNASERFDMMQSLIRVIDDAHNEMIG